MKKLTAIFLVILFAATANAEVLYRRMNTTTTTQFANVVASTGKIADATAAFTLKCGCISAGGSLDLDPGSCNAGTTVAEVDTNNGVYNLTINAADTNGEYCFILATAGDAGAVDHLFEIRTAEYMSYFDITSQTATQPAMKLTGNTSGSGLLSVGGASNGNGVTFQAGSGTGAGLFAYAPNSGNAGGIYALGNSSGVPGISAQGSGTGAGLLATGGATSGNGASFIGGGTGTGSYHYSAGGVGSYILSGAAQGLRVAGSSYGATVTGTGAYGAVSLTPGTTATSVITCTGNNCTSQVVNAARKW